MSAGSRSRKDRMARGRRCDTSKAALNSRRGDASSGNLTTKNNSTTPVCQATTGPGPEPMRLWQADEGCVSPKAGGRKRTPAAPTASRYFLRSSRAPICAGDTRAGPGMRPATSSIIVAAKKTRSRLASSDEVERQKADEAPITKSPEQAEKKHGKRQQNQKYLAPRMKRGEVNTHTHNTHTTHTHTHKRISARTHTCARTHAHTLAHAHAGTHTRRYTRTHAPPVTYTLV